MINSIPITYSITVYNEEKRIKYILDHATKWADEVVVFNKSSTDKTKEICLQYKNIKVYDIPFSVAGGEDTVALFEYFNTDWIFVGVASEIPTRKLILKIREILAETKGELDLINVPKKYFSMGVHSEHSPWYINYSAFLINRKKAIIQNKIHESYKASNPENTYTIPFADDCCVYHLTHPSAKNYIHHMTQYFEVEAKHCTDPDKDIQECFEMIAGFEERMRQGGTELLGAYCAWPIYWLGKALFIWEKYRGHEVLPFYEKIKKELIEKEWSKPFDPENNQAFVHEKINDQLPPSQWTFTGKIQLGKSFRPKEKLFFRILGSIRASKLHQKSKIFRGILQGIKKTLHLRFK